MERVNSLFAVLFVVFLCSLVSGQEKIAEEKISEEKIAEAVKPDSNETTKVCKQDHAKKGALWCKESFKLSYISNKETRMIHNPMNTACCLSYNMAECIEYSYILANCTVVEEEVTKYVEEAQNEANKPAYLSGSFLCAEQSEVKCKYLMVEYDKARKLIELLNGATSQSLHTMVVIASSLLFVLRRS